jgi:hypothetical protein
MTFSYPTAEQSIQKGNRVYRVKAQAIELQASGLTPLGPGSLIPINVGFSAIAVGPESAFSDYELYYPDALAPGGIQRVPFGVGAPFIGSVPTDNDGVYPLAPKQKAVAFVRVKNKGPVRQNQYIAGAAAFTDGIAECHTDLLVYTGAPPAFIPSKRTPISYQGFVPLTASGVPTNYYVPGYGRRFCYLDVSGQDADAGETIDITLRGYRLWTRPDFVSAAIIDGSAGRAWSKTGSISAQLGFGTELYTAQVVGAQGRWEHHHNAETTGFYDFYELEINGDGGGGGTSPGTDATGVSQMHALLEVRD